MERDLNGRHISLWHAEGLLVRIVVALHDEARLCNNPIVAAHIRAIAHEVSLIADRVRDVPACR